ncbi:MAG: mannose-1-phosphate guanylyltransferase [Bacteroidetes bacterium]|nr:mannose-1-phosphate guanylyltransferase [Bacteroidota bacterium]
MDSSTYCVIMAGGIGSRFWPLSTELQPKQFLDIFGSGKSLLQQTCQRFARMCRNENILVVTNMVHYDLVKEQLPHIPENNILCEPKRKNTAPCIVFASYKIAALTKNANIIVTPSDHLVTKEKEFYETMDIALAQSKKENCLITLGIKPDRPDTGYGYIQFDDRDNSSGHPEIKRVVTFTEKPDHKLAREFLDSGDFYWNSGIFIWNLDSIISALEHHLPKTSGIFKQASESFNTPKESAAITAAYDRVKNISIDYGLMEKARNVYMVLSDFGWSDLGTWGALFEHLPKDEKGNTRQSSDVRFFEAENNMVILPEGKKAIIEGLTDYIVVDANNALLICRKENEQKIKEMTAPPNPPQGGK